MNIKTSSDLKYAVEQAGTAKHFFTRSTMKFWGDTMRNYGVRRTTVSTATRENLPAYELYRRHPVKHGLCCSSYFHADTFELLHVKE